MLKTADTYKSEIQDILDFLNGAKVRATYGAVANLLGITTDRLIEFLGEPRQETSWIVNKSTGMPGCPPGYPKFPSHPDLKVRDGHIQEAVHLAEAMELYRKSFPPRP